MLGRIAALAPAGALAVEEVLPMSFESLYEATATSFYAGERYAVDSSWSVDAGTLFAGLAEAIAAAPSAKAFALGVVLPPAAIAAGLPDAAFSMAGPAFGAAYAIWDAPEQDAAQRRLAARHRRPAGAGDARPLRRRGRPRPAGLARGLLRAGGARPAQGVAGAARPARRLRALGGGAEAARLAG